MIRYQSMVKSARYAARGLAVVWSEEQNFRIEVVLGIIALALAWVLSCTASEIAILLLLIGAILAAECINSALERIIDGLKPRVSDYVRVIKDVTAAMMLVLAITAVLVGCVIFIPKLVEVAIVMSGVFY